MCPFCMTSVALLAAGGTSAGGLAMFAIMKRRNQPFQSMPRRRDDYET